MSCPVYRSQLVQNRHPVFSHNPFGGYALGIVPHEHIGEVGAIVDTWSITRAYVVIIAQWLDNRIEVGLVEVGKSIALASIEANFVGGGSEVISCQVLHHVS